MPSWNWRAIPLSGRPRWEAMTSIWYRFENDVVTVDRWAVHADAPAGGTGNGATRSPSPLREILPLLVPALDAPALAYVVWSELDAEFEIKLRVEALVAAVEVAIAILWRELKQKLNIDYSEALFSLLIAVLEFARDLAFKLAIPVLIAAAVGALLTAFAPEIALSAALILALAKLDGFAEAAYAIDLEVQALLSAWDLKKDFKLVRSMGQALLRLGRGAREAWDVPANPGLRQQRIKTAGMDIAAGLEVLVIDMLTIGVQIAMLKNDPADKVTDHIPALASDVGVSGDVLKKRLTSFVTKNARHLILPRN